MSKFVTIETTPDDIQAWRMDEDGAEHCPIFRALARAGVAVEYVVESTVKTKDGQFPLSKKAHDFVLAVDAPGDHPDPKPVRLRIQVA